MDKIAEKLSLWFGSAPFILLHAVWWAVWFILGLGTEPLLVTVSLEAIVLALFILRAENVQSSRTEHSVKQDLSKSDEQLRLLRQIKKELGEQRYMK